MRKFGIVAASAFLFAAESFAGFALNCIEDRTPVDGAKTTLSLNQNGDSSEYLVKKTIESVRIDGKVFKKEEDLGRLQCKFKINAAESMPVQYFLNSGTCARNDLPVDGISIKLSFERGSAGHKIIEDLRTPGQMGVGAKHQVEELGAAFSCSMSRKEAGSSESSGDSKTSSAR